MTGLFDGVCVRDAGLSCQTAADGLAVGRASGLVCRAVQNLVAGCGTVKDERLSVYQRLLWETEGLFAEPSACAAFALPERVDAKGTNILWATGGSLLPGHIRRSMIGA